MRVQERIKKLKEETDSSILDVQIRRLDGYFNVLRDYFRESNPQDRVWLYDRLESLITYVDEDVKVSYDPIRAKEIRESKGLTQSDLAKRLNMTQQQVSSFERGRTKFRERSCEGSPAQRYLGWLVENSGYSLEEII